MVRSLYGNAEGDGMNSKLPALDDGYGYGFSTGYEEDADDILHIFDNWTDGQGSPGSPLCMGENEEGEAYRLEYVATSSDMLRPGVELQACYVCLRDYEHRS